MAKSALSHSFYEIVREKTVDTQAVTIPQEFCSALSYICADPALKSQPPDFQSLLSECSTWRLISMLQEDILESGMMEDVVPGETVAKAKCDAEIINDLFLRSPDLRHLQVIVDWLQESAGEVAQQLYHACEIRWPNPTDFWASLNDETYSDKVKYLRNLQLDVIFDECNSLSPALGEDVDLLYRAVFHLLRAGEFSRAQELCAKVGHHWLTAVIGVHRFFEDCPYEKLTSSTNVGNRRRLLWQSVAWSWLQQAAANPEKGNIYERAVFGLLCGRLESVLPVAKTWHDRVWACVTTYLSIKTTKELLEKSQENEECFLPVAYFDQLKDVASIFRIADEGKKQSPSLFEQVQKCLIEHGLDNFSELLAFFLQVASSLENEMCDEGHVYSLDDLRFCVHMLQWLKVLGITPASDQNLAPIYVKYVTMLSSSPENVDLAAFYTSQMPKPVELEVFVNFLDMCLSKPNFSSQSNEDMFVKRALFEARAVNLSVGKILDHLMRLRLTRFKANEAEVVHTLTWYYLLEPILSSSDGVMVDFLRYSNFVIRMFLLEDKNEHARLAFRNIRPETVTIIAAPTLRTSLTPEERVSSVNACLVREYLCYKALFLSFDRLVDWNAAYTAYAQSSASKQGQPMKDTLEMRDLERATDELVQATYNVLLFAGPGWLVDETDVGSTSSKQDTSSYISLIDRHSQLERLRRHFVPELTLSLLMCLARVGQSRRSDRVQLVDALMSSHPRNLGELFTPQQLTVIARSASCVLAE